ncbi:MAG: Unknown protein [uncultured Campylobacterales bacterium]|uniref:Aspartate/ornithine carbamoyltransferase carbamoyl-P binding domain-containing protein n=1 Tax=uncultured Campylobacterales bacterium TaxID=352960 RepID=A0A6S6SCY0_9BACT|nr:MAG: Unknown protein [uncultured Campylobacterales bacterium]
MRIIESTDNLTLKEIQNIITSSKEYKKNFSKKLLGLLFFAPSTRTRTSFSSAIYKLGGNFIDIDPKKLDIKTAKR